MEKKILSLLGHPLDNTIEGLSVDLREKISKDVFSAYLLGRDMS